MWLDIRRTVEHASLIQSKPKNADRNNKGYDVYLTGVMDLIYGLYSQWLLSYHVVTVTGALRGKIYKANFSGPDSTLQRHPCRLIDEPEVWVEYAFYMGSR